MFNVENNRKSNNEKRNHEQIEWTYYNEKDSANVDGPLLDTPVLIWYDIFIDVEAFHEEADHEDLNDHLVDDEEEA